MGVQSWDLGEQIYAIAAILFWFLFWSGGILIIPALWLWAKIAVGRDRKFFDDPNPPCPPYGDAASGHR
jgi:hypothetical protein